MSVEDILNGPDYFYCERFRARMSKQACVERQNKKYNASSGDYAPLECMKCEQGAIIKEEKEGRRMTRRITRVECLVEGCTEEATVRGLCKVDYNKWRQGKLPGVQPLPSKKAREKMAKNIEPNKWDLTNIIKDYPEVQKFLEESARTHMRPVNYEIVWLLRQGVEKENTP